MFFLSCMCAHTISLSVQSGHFRPSKTGRHWLHFGISRWTAHRTATWFKQLGAWSPIAVWPTAGFVSVDTSPYVSVWLPEDHVSRTGCFSSTSSFFCNITSASGAKGISDQKVWRFSWLMLFIFYSLLTDFQNTTGHFSFWTLKSCLHDY